MALDPRFLPPDPRINWASPQARGLTRCYVPSVSPGNLFDIARGQNAAFTGSVAQVMMAAGHALDVPNTAGAATAGHYVDTGIFPTAAPCALFVRLSFDTVPATAQSFGLHDGTRRLYMGVEGDGDYFLGAGDSFHNTTDWSPAAGQIYDALLALDGSTARFYIDGAEVVSFAYGWTGAATRSIWLGARSHSSAQTACDVKIYEARVYQGWVPTAAEAAAMSHPATKWDLYDHPRILPFAGASIIPHVMHHRQQQRAA